VTSATLPERFMAELWIGKCRAMRALTGQEV
jgi:hypothetical protein